MFDSTPSLVHTRRLILREAERLDFSSAVDIGCGSGLMIAALRARFPDRSYSGADIAQTALERACRRVQGISLHRLDIQKEALEGRFDLVVCSEVIEHLEDPLAALKNMRRMCSGHLILTTPTGELLPTDRAFFHLRHFTPEELRELAAAAGFEALHLYRWGWPFQVLFQRLINLAPRAAHQAFISSETYGPLKRAVNAFWSALFYLNVAGGGTRLVLVAK